jgi:hypothetical protein
MIKDEGVDKMVTVDFKLPEYKNRQRWSQWFEELKHFMESMVMQM